MAEHLRKRSKYEHFRLRPKKDDDIYDALEKHIACTKIDYPDIVRCALRNYLQVTNDNTNMNVAQNAHNVPQYNSTSIPITVSKKIPIIYNNLPDKIIDNLEHNFEKSIDSFIGGE
jgi:hypothetical protein